MSRYNVNEEGKNSGGEDAFQGPVILQRVLTHGRFLQGHAFFESKRYRLGG
jgi:hypothetical protein